jgi:tetratricopeptide (TPR) repeat protein
MWIEAEVLNYAAVIGRRFDFELLHKLTGLAEADLLRSVALLIERQLVIEERGAEDRYTFRHALTREAIYDDMLGRERRIKHRAVLHALDELYPEQRDAIADQLAYHSLQAKELAQAGRYARLAGDKAVRMHAYRDALAHYETALELLETDDPREKAELFDKLTEAAWSLADTNLQARYMQAAQRLYAQLGDRRKVGDFSAWMGWVAQLQGDMEAAFAHTRTAIELLEGEPAGPELAMAYSSLSRLYMLTTRPHDSIEWGEQALYLADALGDADVRANTLQNIGLSLVQLGETRRGIAHLEQALDLAKRAGPHRTVARAYINLGFTLYAAGQLKRAAEIAREMIAFEHEYGIVPGTEWTVLGIAQIRLGQWHQAHETLDRGISAGELVEPAARLYAIPEKAELLLRQGRLEEARRLESMLPACEKLGMFVHFGTLSAALARTYLALGDTAQAVAFMDHCIAAWREIGPLVWTESALVGGVEVYLRAGQEQSARELLDALATIAGRTDSPLALAH